MSRESLTCCHDREWPDENTHSTARALRFDLDASLLGLFSRSFVQARRSLRDKALPDIESGFELFETMTPAVH